MHLRQSILVQVIQVRHARVLLEEAAERIRMHVQRCRSIIQGDILPIMRFGVRHHRRQPLTVLLAPEDAAFRHRARKLLVEQISDFQQQTRHADVPEGRIAAGCMLHLQQLLFHALDGRHHRRIRRRRVPDELAQTRFRREVPQFLGRDSQQEGSIAGQADGGVENVRADADALPSVSYHLLSTSHNTIGSDNVVISRFISDRYYNYTHQSFIARYSWRPRKLVKYFDRKVVIFK